MSLLLMNPAQKAIKQCFPDTAPDSSNPVPQMMRSVFPTLFPEPHRSAKEVLTQPLYDNAASTLLALNLLVNAVSNYAEDPSLMRAAEMFRVKQEALAIIRRANGGR